MLVYFTFVSHFSLSATFTHRDNGSECRVGNKPVSGVAGTSRCGQCRWINGTLQFVLLRAWSGSRVWSDRDISVSDVGAALYSTNGGIQLIPLPSMQAATVTVSLSSPWVVVGTLLLPSTANSFWLPERQFSWCPIPSKLYIKWGRPEMEIATDTR
jgi:hypothetical protein